MQGVIANPSQYKFECAGVSLYVAALTGDSHLLQDSHHPVRNIDGLQPCLLVIVYDTETYSRFGSVFMSIPVNW